VKWSQNLFTIGFLFIFLGLLLVIMTSVNLDGGFVFFFPFFFFGSSGSSVMYILIGISFIIFFVMMCILPSIINQRYSQQQSEVRYVAIGSTCEYCGNPIPTNAIYCPVCGNAVRSNQPLE